MKKNKSLLKYFLYYILVFFLFFNQKLSNSQESNNVKKIIIEDQQKTQRLLSPPTDKSEKKIKLIPPKEIQKKIAEEEREKQLKIKKKAEEKRKKELELKKKAEEKRKKELELKKKAEEKRKKELELKKKAEEERKIAAEKEKKKENIVKEIQVIQDQKNKEKVQENESKSTKGVLRGLHYQLPPCSQTKLVKVTKGSILDVIIDLRPESKTFCKHFSINLSSDKLELLYVPKNFAHGFITLKENTEVFYQVSNFYNKGNETGVRWNDPIFDIDWPTKNPIISDKDKNHPNFRPENYQNEY